jgi:hypothetical protein
MRNTYLRLSNLPILFINGKKKYIDKNFDNTVAGFSKFYIENEWSSNIEEDKMFVLYLDPSIDNFIMILTSESLLKNLMNQKLNSGQPAFFNVDATYKILSTGFLLLTLCTEDPKHRFRFIACAIVLHENEVAYTKFIEEIKKFLLLNHEFDWSPKFCMSDGADAIHSAVKSIFPEITQLLCYFHVKKAIKRRITTTKDVNHRKLLRERSGGILYGIKLLHKTKSRQEFVELWNLLLQKWNALNVPTEFTNYLYREYIDVKRYWNIGSVFVGWK